MVLSSAEDSSEAVFFDWEATQISSRHCKPDLRPQPLLLLLVAAVLRMSPLLLVAAAVLRISPRHCR